MATDVVAPPSPPPSVNRGAGSIQYYPGCSREVPERPGKTEMMAPVALRGGCYTSGPMRPIRNA